MSLLQGIRRLLLIGWATVAVASGPALAQPAAEFQPQPGQQGKDVIWLPTAQALVDRMLDLGQVAPGDYVIDLGSGDGRTVITAAKRGATALGIEYNPDMVALSERNAAREGVGARATFMKADLFEADLSRATVITMFLLPDINLKLRPRILGLRPGTRVVSNSFDMGDWTADRTVQVSQGCKSFCKAYLWIVPARVEGAWRLQQGELRLQQTYQKIAGTFDGGGRSVPITKASLRGDRIAFTAGKTRYEGQVSEGGMQGIMRQGGRQTRWQATAIGAR